MTVLIWAVVGFAAVVAFGLIALARVRRLEAPPTPAAPAAVLERRAVVVLDVDRADPGSQAVQRLVREAAGRVFAAMPDVEEVEVRARDGRVLGRVPRVTPEPRLISVPEFLYEPHIPRRRGPDLSGHLGEDEPFVPPRETAETALPARSAEVAAEVPAEPPRPFAERVDLDPAIRSAIRDPNDPMDVIRAILEVGALHVERDDELLRVDGMAIVAVRAVDGGIHEALNHAYRRIESSGAERGLVVSLGHVATEEIRRRELLAPHVLHTGLAGVQRMADAAALGADPVRFAIAPALAASRGASP
jgi:hypothetical protein